MCVFVCVLEPLQFIQDASSRVLSLLVFSMNVLQELYRTPLLSLAASISQWLITHCSPKSILPIVKTVRKLRNANKVNYDSVL